VKAVDLATDHRGSSYGAVDLGHLFGSAEAGGRARESGRRKDQSYVNDANGWRAVGAGAADWKISPKAILKGDFEYQHKVERSVCGLSTAGRNDRARSQPGLSLDDAGRAAVGQAEYLRHLQHRRAAGLRSSADGAPLPRRVTAIR
jgi:hypothetical protein